MSSDVWIGALTTFAGASLGGAISFVLAHQQLNDAREQREDQATREKALRSEDRRFSAYADFHIKARRYRSAIRPYRLQEGPRMPIQEIDALAHSADAASSLVFLVLESRRTYDACRNVVRTIGNTLAILHERESDLDSIPWSELNNSMALAIRTFQAAAREELEVEGIERTAILERD